MAKAINSWIFLDFETGGLDPKKHAVTEVALIAIKGDTLEKIDLISTYIKPYGNFEYDPAALKHTGITFSDIESGISVQDAVQEILELLNKADFNPRNKGSKPILVAQNSAFDKGFFLQIFDFTKKMKELEKVCFGKEDYYGNFQPEMLDTQFLTKAAFGNDPDIPNFKLETCMAKAGVELPDAHKAINDTIGMKDMSIVLFNRLRSGGSSGQGVEINTGTRFREHFQF
jgi:DNA polymerase III epsilon subunit-like protein